MMKSLLSSLLLWITFPGAAFADTVPSPIHGVTIDSIDNLSAITESLSRFSRKPTTRIVFDEGVNATSYVKAAAEIHKVSYVMGEILDSFYMKQYSLSQYRARTVEYLNALGNNVDIWEVGNEINGEWLGGDVPAKMKAAYDEVKRAGKTTALTLYYNYECWENKSNEMFTWAENNVPQEMKDGLDYVLVSYYEDDCNGYQPNWQDVFSRLSKMFPRAKLGMGEAGTTKSGSKAAYVNRYYSMNLKVPNYVGGVFWWYFKQDGVPYTKPLWATINTAFERQPTGGGSEVQPTPTPMPTIAPTKIPTAFPTVIPTKLPTTYPTPIPTAAPTKYPTVYPTAYPTWKYPTVVPPKKSAHKKKWKPFRNLIAR